MSPFADMERAAQQIGADFVLSHKPSPALLAVDDWNIEHPKKVLSHDIEVSKGCHVEIILKDISTLRYEPRRLWQWAEMAMEVVSDMC